MSYDPFMSKALELQEERIKFQHELANANATIKVAMARVEALEAENAKLREAAGPIAKNATAWTMNDEDRVLVWSRRGHADFILGDLKITVGDIIRLNEALNANP